MIFSEEQTHDAFCVHTHVSDIGIGVGSLWIVDVFLAFSFCANQMSLAFGRSRPTSAGSTSSQRSHSRANGSNGTSAGEFLIFSIDVGSTVST